MERPPVVRTTAPVEFKPIVRLVAVPRPEAIRAVPPLSTQTVSCGRGTRFDQLLETIQSPWPPIQKVWTPLLGLYWITEIKLEGLECCAPNASVATAFIVNVPT